MSLILKDDTGNREFKLLPPGTHDAVCIGIYDLGPQVSEYNGEKKEQLKVRLQFEVPSERTTWTDADGNEHEGPMTVGKTYTASLYEKAKLCEHLESWRGKSFTQTEKMGFNIENVLGKPCQLAIKHKTHQASGNTWADITLIMPPSAAGKGLKPENDPVIFDFHQHSDAELEALPEWIQKKVEDGKALQKEQRDRVRNDFDRAPEPATDDFEDSDIPFNQVAA